jgi:hypothetical protein
MQSEPQKLPSLKEMVYSLTDSVKEALARAVEGHTILATEEQALARLDICLTCEFFITQPEGSIMPARCSRCGCGMKVKSRIATSFCPINKWGPIPPTS